MGSVASTGFSVANLLQSLTSGSPQVSSALSSSSVQTALQGASTSDLVSLSGQAVQLQEADLLFGDSNTASGTPITPTIPSALNPLSSLLPSSSSTAPSTTPMADQLAGYQSDLQSQEMQSLFGVGQSGPALSSLFDVLG
jgi:hypothetical protein